jgi:hypothetical protein
VPNYSSYSGNIDDSDLPLLPWWYIPGITAQNVATATLPAPTQNTFSELPSSLIYVTVTGNYADGGGNWLGGYMTFEQSNDLLLNNAGTFYRIPARLTGAIPLSNTLGFNWNGSGRVYLQFGQLVVNLLATDTAGVTIQDTYANTQVPGYEAPVSWIYHVKEYFQGGMEYDIAPVISQASTTGVDINTLDSLRGRAAGAGAGDLHSVRAGTEPAGRHRA